MTTDCPHTYWLIETSAGEFSTGMCILCRTMRDFPNAPPFQTEHTPWSVTAAAREALLAVVPPGYAKRGNEASRTSRCEARAGRRQ